MAQLSLFEKRKNYSNKDVSVMIGKSNIIYFTFRNNSWKKFTNSEYIRIWVEKGKLKLGDGEVVTDLGRKFKLTINEQNKNPELCRYVKIVGRKMPEVLEICERINGKSYDLTPEKSESSTPDNSKDVTSWGFKQVKKLEPVTSEELVKSFSPDISKLLDEEEPQERKGFTFAQFRKWFNLDLTCRLEQAQSKEERTAIYNAMAALYGGYMPKNTKVIPMPEPATEEQRKKWEV